MREWRKVTAGVDTMVLHFLCPRGHHLTAAPDQSEQPASCPRCQATFLVPRDSQVSNGPHGEAAEPLAENLQQAAILDALKSESKSAPEEQDSPEIGRESWPGILAGLLESRGANGTVALEIEGGEKITVDNLMLARSSGEIAVLIVQAGENRNVLAVPWRRITACRLNGWMTPSDSI